MAIAIITGASSGIGKCFAEHIQKTGEVDGYLLIARRRGKLEELAATLGEGAEVLEADLGTTAGVEAVRAWLEEHRPSVRYLINAAGFGIFGDYTEVSEAETVGMIDLNVKALVLITHMVIPYMVKGGNILELGSASVFTPLPRFNIYDYSVELEEYNIDISKEEMNIIATYMIVEWLGQQLASVELSRMKYSGSDFKFTS